MRIALATCRNLPAWEVDDVPLHAVLRERGVDLQTPAWDDPDFDWSACAACLIRTTWNYMERRDEFVAWAERTAGETRLFNPPQIVRWNTRKTYLRDLERYGASVVPTVWTDADRQVDVVDVMARHNWLAGFLKPVIGATARETLRFTTDDDGLAAAATHMDRLGSREALMLQPYLPRVETDGEISVIYIDGRVSHIVRKRPVPGDYRVQDDFGATDEPWTLSASDLAVADGVMSAACAFLHDARASMASVDWPLLYARVDMLRDDDGRLLCNELELVEPSLFFRHGREAGERLASALLGRVG